MDQADAPAGAVALGPAAVEEDTGGPLRRGQGGPPPVVAQLVREAPADPLDQVHLGGVGRQSP
ncbi:MAG TPA: hypothetical protein VHK63_09505, partial [Candidatus Limnocylindria bacterium]|nr:hypothetical protein [Candidatus Limnocylindria bacterium]